MCSADALAQLVHGGVVGVDGVADVPALGFPSGGLLSKSSFWFRVRSIFLVKLHGLGGDENSSDCEE